MQVTFDNVHTDKHKLVNDLFRFGYVLFVRSTGEVVGVHVSKDPGKPSRGVKVLPKCEDMAELARRYPNCRKFCSGDGKLAKSTVDQLRYSLPSMQPQK